ncbi:uncharacterized protein B0H18DRAFT_1123198 [Fomitopsis serialis]|uniref:uncharacterized protein n=1 Tax=Fomitopsis serialis TaxID=139415 RepID=UPI0020077F87|nr:uncharacterized protein B0H18DRAFT_1123198 [Neoantrodia serialis]KAH9918158.1 hypothetical protein B0H18DRAFT_1123198 [Neoantrodia serialis]
MPNATRGRGPHGRGPRGGHRRGGSSSAGRTTSTASKRSAPAPSDTDNDLELDVSTASTHQTRRKKARTSEVDAQDTDSDFNLDEPSASPPSPAVTVRRTARQTDPHPACSAGLHKRSKTEIAEVAERKRAEDQAEADAREQEARLLEEKEDAGTKTIAALQDRHAEEEALLDEAGMPLDGYESDVNMVEQEEDDTAANGDKEQSEEERSASESAPPASRRKDKKRERVVSVLSAIDSHRQLPPPASPPASSRSGTHKSKAKTSAGNTAKSVKSKQASAKTSGLNEDWRAIIDGAGLARHDDATMSTKSTNAPKKRHGRAQGKKDSKEESAVQERGLADSDVALKKEDMVVLRKSQEQFVEIIDSDTEVPTPAKAKRARRAPADIPQEKSRGAAAVVPAAIFSVWFTKIHPTLIELYGSLDNPWDISLDDVRDNIKAILAQVCPKFRITDLTDTQFNKFVEHCATKVRDWRKGLLLKAKRLVDADLKRVDGGKAGRAKHVKDALEPHGAAFNNVVDGKAGRMKSVYILKTFAKHLKTIENSCMHRPRPSGALALCYAAVQASFEQWQSGSDQGTPAWDGDAARDLVLGAFRTNIEWLSRHTDQFDTIIKAAKETQKSETYRQPREPKARVVRLYTPSGSEAEGDGDAGDEGQGSSGDGDDD